MVRKRSKVKTDTEAGAKNGITFNINSILKHSNDMTEGAILEILRREIYRHKGSERD